MKPPIPSLSVILIVKNGAATIEQCLSSVQPIAAEIIILDSGSTDETLLICKKYTNLIFETDWPGHGIQKNRALAKATGDWVLSIDADEWLSSTLQKTITTAIQTPSADLYSFKRRTQYCGHWIRFGDVGKDIAVRLFKRDAAKFNDNIVHEGLITNKKPQFLEGYLYHNSYRNYEEIMSRMNHYTTLSAQTRLHASKKTSFSKAVFSATWAFAKSYIFRFGFLDGKIGFIVAVTSAESSFYRHLKLLSLLGLESDAQVPQ